MHRRLAAVVAVAWCLGITGCSVWSYAWRVNVTEQRLFCEEEDDKISMATYRSWADQAWAETGACCPEDCRAADYAWGFREGFAEYVYAGGNGEPPAMPPRPYWQVDLRSREGAAAASSWFEGYRQGARVAKEGGYREATTLKLSGSLRDCDACGCRDNKSCPLQLSAPYEVSGPVLDTPGVIPPPAEVVIPFEESISPEPAALESAIPDPAKDSEPASKGPPASKGGDDDSLTPPLLNISATMSAPTSSPVTSPRVEPVATRAADQGRVRTALFQIVR